MSEDRQQQEYEFVMEGITTRMQTALEKMAESNQMMADINRRMADGNRRQGQVMIVVLVIVMLGFIVNNVIMINHVNNIRNEVSAHETISQLGPGAND